MFVSLLQKRSRLVFDGSDEEEITDLLVGLPARPTPVAGQSLVAEDAWIGSSELVDLRTRGALPVAEVPEEIVDTHLSRIERGTERLKERLTTIEVLSEEEAEAMTPSALVEAEFERWLGVETVGLLTLRYWETV